MPGTLYVVATPIGNVEDLSARALRILQEISVLACEDTRHTGILLKRLGVPHGDRRFMAYHDMNEARQAPQILSLLQNGTDVALVTDAGTPLVSDPGYRLVSAARAAGVMVVPIPGPCAAIAALSASGLPSDRFTFLGFLPVKSGRRDRVIEGLSAEQGTVIFYVPARSLKRTLQEIGAKHPGARIVIAREITKIYEEFVTGTPAECLTAIGEREPKGEVTLLVNVA